MIKPDLFWPGMFILAALGVFSAFMTWVSIKWLEADYDKGTQRRTFNSKSMYRLLFWVFTVPYLNLAVWVAWGFFTFLRGLVWMIQDFFPWYNRVHRKFFKEAQ